MRRALLALSMFTLGAVATVALAAPSAEERAKICAKAEERYVKLFGKASKDEDVVIVKMYKYNFCPFNLEIKRGTKVRWVNVDKRTSHSVWFKEQGGTESDRVFGEETVEMVLDLPPGVNPYICGPHGEQEHMIGTVKIVD